MLMLIHSWASERFILSPKLGIEAKTAAKFFLTIFKVQHLKRRRNKLLKLKLPKPTSVFKDR